MMIVVARTNRDPMSLVPEARRLVLSVDPLQPIEEVKTSHCNRHIVNVGPAHKCFFDSSRQRLPFRKLPPEYSSGYLLGLLTLCRNLQGRASTRALELKRRQLTEELHEVLIQYRQVQLEIVSSSIVMPWSGMGIRSL